MTWACLLAEGPRKSKPDTYTSINTGRVGHPNIPVQVFDRLAGVDVDELTVDDNRDTLLASDNIGSDEFSSHVYEWDCQQSTVSACVEDVQNGPTSPSGLRMHEWFPKRIVSTSVVFEVIPVKLVNSARVQLSAGQVRWGSDVP